MKKKGFTLIELLAVIVVLAVVSLVAIPIVTGIINKTKANSLKSTAYGLLEAADLYYAQYYPKNNIRFDIENSKITSNDTEKMLQYKGSIKSATIIVSTKRQHTLCVTDGTNAAYKNYNDKNIILVERDSCYIPENYSIVYLEASGATRTELSNQELTDELAAVKDQLSSLSSELRDMKNQIYPVGSIYMSSIDDTVEKVQNRFGGTWEVYATGKTLVGVDGSQAEFNEVEKTGGEKTHTLSINEMPAHSHIFWYNWSGAGSVGGNWKISMVSTSNGGAGTWPNSSGLNDVSKTGESQAHNNLQPYITVYMYKRIS